MFVLMDGTENKENMADLAEIYRLRHRVFVDRLGWVSSQNGLERDRYDNLPHQYIIYRDPVLGVVACVRMLPTTGPYMMSDTFPQILNGVGAPRSEIIHESSRFCVDTAAISDAGWLDTQSITMGLLAAMVEYGIHCGLESIVSVTGPMVERIIKRSGWNISRLSAGARVGKTKAIPVIGETSAKALDEIRAKHDIKAGLLHERVRLIA